MISVLVKAVKFEGILTSSFEVISFGKFSLLLFIAVHSIFPCPTVMAVDPILDRVLEF